MQSAQLTPYSWPPPFVQHATHPQARDQALFYEQSQLQSSQRDQYHQLSFPLNETSAQHRNPSYLAQSQQHQAGFQEAFYKHASAFFLNGERVRKYEPKINTILKMRINSKSIENFGVQILRDAFTVEELSDPNTNLNGKNAKGAVGPPKKALDPERMIDIHEILNCFITGDQKQKNKEWALIKQAFNKELSYLKSHRRN